MPDLALTSAVPSVLTVLFRVSEKVATPTSVVLISLGSAFGFYWRTMMMKNGCLSLAIHVLLYVLDTTALISAFKFVLIKPTPLVYTNNGYCTVAIGFGYIIKKIK